MEEEERKEVYRMYMYNLSRNNLGLGHEAPISKTVNNVSKRRSSNNHNIRY